MLASYFIKHWWVSCIYFLILTRVTQCLADYQVKVISYVIKRVLYISVKDVTEANITHLPQYMLRGFFFFSPQTILSQNQCWLICDEVYCIMLTLLFHWLAETTSFFFFLFLKKTYIWMYTRRQWMFRHQDKCLWDLSSCRSLPFIHTASECLHTHQKKTGNKLHLKWRKWICDLCSQVYFEGFLRIEPIIIAELPGNISLNLSFQ